MGLARLFVLLLVATVLSSVWCHHHHRGAHDETKKGKDQSNSARSFEFRDEDVNAVLTSDGENGRKKGSGIDGPKGSKGIVPLSRKRLEKMLEKAILQIITGDLSTADMLLLKSLNYSLEEVLAIRERELSRRKDEETKKEESLKSWTKILYGEDTAGKKDRQWKKNTMEVDYSSPGNPEFADMKYNEKKNRQTEKSSYDKDFDFDAYNRQAVVDYENLASKVEFQQSWSDPALVDYEDSARDSKERESVENYHRYSNKAMEPHVIFKIRYDDSEFDSNSNSDEKDHVFAKTSKHRSPSSSRHTTLKNSGNSFHVSPVSPLASSSSTSFGPVRTPVPIVYQLGNSKNSNIDYPKNHVHPITTTTPIPSTSATGDSPGDVISVNAANAQPLDPTTDSNYETSKEKESHRKTDETRKRVSEYEGLEWIEDDVYRVIPAFVDSLGYENNEENETSDYEDGSNYYQQNWNSEGNETDTLEYQNDTPDPVKTFMANVNVTGSNLSSANLSTYQQSALINRQKGNVTSSIDSQGQKTIEAIKSMVLAVTGRSNHSNNANQVQQEKLTMFSPTCQVPRNSDLDAWTDPFSMNMHFQLNLTSADHVVQAKLRIFILPQENLTSSVSGTFEEEEEDEKKIRISVYYYTKSLKKHRSKKRLMDSVVRRLTPDGAALALDVKQGLRFWRLNPRNPHGNGSNHGLVIQVEDQDGQPLKPALYIQEPSCTDHDSDQKAYKRLPALFIQACARYVRIVNGEPVTYVNCRH